jgi:hypothetical protein
VEAPPAGSRPHLTEPASSLAIPLFGNERRDCSFVETSLPRNRHPFFSTAIAIATYAIHKLDIRRHFGIRREIHEGMVRERRAECPHDFL